MMTITANTGQYRVQNQRAPKREPTNDEGVPQTASVGSLAVAGGGYEGANQSDDDGGDAPLIPEAPGDHCDDELRCDEELDDHDASIAPNPQRDHEVARRFRAAQAVK